MKKLILIATKALFSRGGDLVESLRQKFLKPAYSFLMFGLFAFVTNSYTQITLGISSSNTSFCNGQEVQFESILNNLLSDGTPIGTIEMTTFGPFAQSLSLNCGQNYALNVSGIYSNWNDAICSPDGNCANGGCNRFRDVEFHF